MLNYEFTDIKTERLVRLGRTLESTAPALKRLLADSEECLARYRAQQFGAEAIACTEGYIRALSFAIQLLEIE
jgi:hypothetical protein